VTDNTQYQSFEPRPTYELLAKDVANLITTYCWHTLPFLDFLLCRTVSDGATDGSARANQHSKLAIKTRNLMRHACIIEDAEERATSPVCRCCVSTAKARMKLSGWKSSPAIHRFRSPDKIRYPRCHRNVMTQAARLQVRRRLSPPRAPGGSGTAWLAGCRTRWRGPTLNHHLYHSPSPL
jgi:hypothetical protein